MRAPVGALVKIYYDSPVRVAPGDVLVTPTDRQYLIIDVRVQARGRHVGRQHLRCVVRCGDEPFAGKPHPIVWYRRGKRR